jgi:drug/metabolite transporter (DMT)-like permease
MKESDYKKIDSPVAQAVVVLAGAIVLMLGGWLLTVTKIYPPEPLFAWSIAAAFMLLFALLNSLMSLRADSFAKYWGASMYSYIGLALCTSLAAWLFSGIPLREAGTYRWIYIVVTFGFLVFLSMVNFMKKIVQFAEREEWNQPRRRR